MATYLPKYLDNDRIVVIEGAVDETTELLKHRWDLIFYTGNPTVGKIVASAAAKFLTPTVMELGGKSPVIIDRTVNLSLAAKRVALGKFTNCGQTCIAPDYVFVHKEIADDFVAQLKSTIVDFYTEKPEESPDYSRIVAERHVKRIESLIQSAPASSVVHGGQSDEKKRYVAPTVIYNPPQDSKIMQEEIFGPVLPIVTYEQIQTVVDSINQGEKPLALYLFSTDKATIKLITQHTSSGTLSVNETLTHGTCREIPFGGVGNSGYGNYYGRYSFNTFTHEKGIFHRTMLPDPGLKYPPYNSHKVKMITSLLNLRLPKISTVLGIAVGIGSLAFLAYSWQQGTLQKHIDAFVPK
jgi:aldehyde dehydrogenase (NAD+)